MKDKNSLIRSCLIKFEKTLLIIIFAIPILILIIYLKFDLICSSIRHTKKLNTWPIIESEKVECTSSWDDSYNEMRYILSLKYEVNSHIYIKEYRFVSEGREPTGFESDKILIKINPKNPNKFIAASGIKEINKWEAFYASEKKK